MRAPVANAFVILGIVMAIFAILAFDLYSDRDPYNFGSFSRAYFAMFMFQAHHIISYHISYHIIYHII